MFSAHDGRIDNHPNSERARQAITLIDKPSPAITTKVEMIDTGIAIITMAVGANERKKVIEPRRQNTANHDVVLHQIQR